MICNKCGNEVADSVKFCNKCGNPMKPVAIEETLANEDVPPVVSENKEEAKERKPKENKPKKGKAGLIVSIIILLLLISVVTFAGVMVIRLKPTFNSSVSENSITQYIEDKNNYILSDDGQIRLKLNVELIESFIFENMTKKSEDSDIVINSIKYYPEKDEIKASVKISVLDIEMIFPVRVNYEKEGKDLFISYSCKDPSYGADRLSLSFLSSKLPSEALKGSILIENVLSGVDLNNTRAFDERVDLYFSFNKKEMTSMAQYLEPYKDTDILAILDYAPQTDALWEQSWSDGFDEVAAEDFFAFYNDESIGFLEDEALLTCLVLNDKFKDGVKNKKNIAYQEYAEKVESFVEELVSSIPSDRYSFYAANAKIFSKHTETPLDVSMLGYSSQKPANININSLEIVYDAQKSLAGISYLLDTDSYKVIYTDNSKEQFSKEDYEHIYHEQPAPKGKIETPMPGLGQRSSILKGIKTYKDVPDSEQYFIRYMRHDDAYAYAIVSSVENYEVLEDYFLIKGENDSWSVICEGGGRYVYYDLAEQAAYQDMNIEMLPKYDLGDQYISYSDYGSYSYSIDQTALLQILEFMDPGHACKVQFASIINDHAYVKCESGEQFIVSPGAWINGAYSWFLAETFYLRAAAGEYSYDVFNYTDPIVVTDYDNLLLVTEKLGIPPYIGLQIDNK